jgi:hypothetical protein
MVAHLQLSTSGFATVQTWLASRSCILSGGVQSLPAPATDGCVSRPFRSRALRDQRCGSPGSGRYRLHPRHNQSPERQNRGARAWSRWTPVLLVALHLPGGPSLLFCSVRSAHRPFPSTSHGYLDPPPAIGRNQRCDPPVPLEERVARPSDAARTGGNAPLGGCGNPTETPKPAPRSGRDSSPYNFRRFAQRPLRK